jgi:hypothetical protein
MFVNKDRYHTEWLEEMATFAWKYSGKAPKSVGTIWKFRYDDFDDFVLENNGEFDLPAGSAKMVLEMARFCQHTVLPCDAEEWAEKKVPSLMFSLHDLLQAAFPKDVESGFFKANDCALAPEDVGDDRARCAAFGGLGVILMNACRQLFGPLLTDAEMLKKVGQSVHNTDGYYVSISEP